MSWRTCQLGDVLELRYGKSLPDRDRKIGDIPVYGSGGVNGWHDVSLVSGPGVIVGRKGSVGSVFYESRNFFPIDTAYFVVPKDGQVDLRYAYYLLRSLPLASMNSDVAVPGLNRDRALGLDIRVPSYAVQLSITDILSTYDDLIENNRRRMALLEESARLLYREWFVRLRFPGYEHTSIVDGVPQGWERRTAFDSMHVLSGGTPKTTVPDYWDGETPFYTPKDATDGIWVSACERSVTELGIKNCNSKLYPRETVFITARGTVGKLNMAQVPMAMSQSCYALVGKDHLSQRFVYSAMETGVNALRQQAVGAVFDAIVVDTFKRIKLMVPPASLLRLFDQAVTPVFDQVENLATQNQKLSAARNLLLPRLISGKLAV